MYYSTMKGLLKNTNDCHREDAFGGRGDLAQLNHNELGIATLRCSPQGHHLCSQ